MKKVLVTGGPVYAYLDAVKIITNRFRGGMMAELASALSRDCSVTYLTCKTAVQPKQNPHLKIVLHDGFDDYMRRVQAIAPQVDAVVHGAAVANLIPWKPIKGKFPSHDYKVGEPIPILFKISPRIIDTVKKAAPRVHLFGFKLLSGVDYEELIRAAYGVLRSSGATAVFANDMTDLQQKYAVTKERGIHPMKFEDMAGWIQEMINDEYYHTRFVRNPAFATLNQEDLEYFKAMINTYKSRFTRTEDGYIFGTIAVRTSRGFLTTGRGKKELDEWAWVKRVDHEKRIVQVPYPKATLNAPLLDTIFRRIPRAKAILHYHTPYKKAGKKALPTLPYAPPGTVRDSVREIESSFNIENHGCFIIFDKNREVI